MDKQTVNGKLKRIIYDITHMGIADEDANLFSTANYISPVMMIYLLLELEKEFPVTINDRFMDELPSITINHLANAICICAE